MKPCVLSPCVVSEGSRWCASEHTLYWVDVADGTVFEVKRDDWA